MPFGFPIKSGLNFTTSKKSTVSSITKYGVRNACCSPCFSPKASKYELFSSLSE
jgi:hypothetical protein